MDPLLVDSVPQTMARRPEQLLLDHELSHVLWHHSAFSTLKHIITTQINYTSNTHVH